MTGLSLLERNRINGQRLDQWIGLLVLIGLVVLLAAPAFAHGPADWIRRELRRNAVGEQCCGERDCGELVSGKVVPKADGYHVDAVFRGEANGVPFEHEAHEIVPYSQATPSPDGIYWRCQWGGSRKCFFAPPPSF